MNMTEYCVEMAAKVLKQFHEQLSIILPIDDLVQHLYSQDLLSKHHKDQLKKLTARDDKIRYFFDDMLDPSIRVGYLGLFDEMLSLMENSDDSVVKFIAKKIQSSLSSEAPSEATETPIPEATETPIPKAVIDDEKEVIKHLQAKTLVFLDGRLSKALTDIMCILKKEKFSVKKLINKLCAADRTKNTVFCSDAVFGEIKTYDKLEHQMGKYCSIYDYALLEAFVESTGCEEAIEALTTFTDKMHCSILTKLDLMSVSGIKVNPDSLMPGTYKFVIKYIGEKCTMEVETTIKSIIYEHFYLQKTTIVFRGIGRGCIAFMYQISKAVRTYLLQYNLSDKDLTAFAAYNITGLIIDGVKRKIPSLWSIKDGLGLWPEKVMFKFLAASAYEARLGEITQIIGLCYKYLVKELNFNVIKCDMVTHNFLSDEDLEIIMDAPSDQHRNYILIEYLRHLTPDNLLAFCYLLQGIECQKHIGILLVKALQCFKLVDMTAIPPGINLSCVHCVLKEELDRIDQHISQYLPCSDYSIIIMNFLHVVDRIVDLAQAWSPGTLIKSCAKMVANDHLFPYFSTEYLKKLSSHQRTISVIRRLSFLWTWKDHSVLNHLVDFCNEAVSMLDNFDSQIKCLLLIKELSLSPNSSDTVFDISSTNLYRKLMLTVAKDFNFFTLEDLNYIQAVFADQCKIIPLVLQLLAVENLFTDHHLTRLHYMISQCVVSDVIQNVRKNQDDIFHKGIVEIEIPGLVIHTGKESIAHPRETKQMKMAMRIKELEEENLKLHKQLLNKNITETVRFNTANCIGSGRHGKVFKGLFDNKVCAVKLICRKLLNTSQSIEEVIAELDAKCHLCLGLHHPNLVEFIKVTKVDNEATVITELMTMNLYSYINQNNKAFSLDTQVSLCGNISQGLQELHQIPLFHQNLHDCNILIKDDQAKISDFYYPLLDFYKDPVVPYVPPEGFQSSHSDIYSLGVLFIQIITGAIEKSALQQIVNFVREGLTLKESGWNKERQKDVRSAQSTSHVQLCKHIIRGHCPSGSRCVFAHSYEELERWKTNMISSNTSSAQPTSVSLEHHVLLQVIQECLRENTENRPSITNIWEQIKDVKANPEYFIYRALQIKDSLSMFEALQKTGKQLRWRNCRQLPYKMWGAYAAVLDNTIYVSGGITQDDISGRFVFAYHLLKNTWETLPQPNHSHGIPVVADNKLYIIGGRSNKKNKRYTNQVSMYHENEWKPCCSLKKDRFKPLAIAYNGYIIVAGGKYVSLSDYVHDNIEIIKVKDPDGKWKIVPTKLPMKMWAPSATISNDQLWIAGFNGHNYIRKDWRSDEVCGIPVNDVLDTTEDRTKNWKHLPRYVPYYSAAVVPNSSSLVLVGGDTQDAKTVSNAIVKYDPSNHHWDGIGSLDGPSRAYTTVACIGEQQAIIVMGGCTVTSDERSIRDSDYLRNNSCLDLVQIGFVE